MRKLVWTSDTHLDLTTDGIDRNPEIEEVITHVVNHAVAIKAYYFVFGGDITDGIPSDDAIAIIIRALNILQKAGIIVFWMDGNHEKKSRGGQPSYFHYLKDLQAVYTNVHWVHDVKTIKIFKDCYFTFFPHINKAMLPPKFKSPQEYIDYKAENIINKFDFFWQHFVFSHLNVRGVVPGSEEHMLKKSEVYLPDQFHTKNYLDKPFPTVLNAHIHTEQRSGWANIIGSPIYVSFGEKEAKKYFAVVDIATKRSECSKIHLLESPCRRFHEISLEIKNGKFDPDAQVGSAMQHVGKRDYVKVDVVANEGFTCDWEALRQKMMKQCHYVLPIKPRFIRRRVVRNAKQRLSLNPTDAINVFVKTNKPKLSKSILKVAKRYIEGLE